MATYSQNFVSAPTTPPVKKTAPVVLPKTGSFALTNPGLSPLTTSNVSQSLSSGQSQQPTVSGFSSSVSKALNTPLQGSNQPNFGTLPKLAVESKPAAPAAPLLGKTALSPNSNLGKVNTVLSSKDEASPSKVAGFTRKGNDVYDAQGNYVSYEQAQKMGIVPLLAGIPQAPSQQPSPTTTSGGPNLTAGGFSETTGGQMPQMPQQATQQSMSSPGGLYGQLIGALGMRGLQDSPDVANARNALLDFNNRLAQQYTNIQTTPIPLEFQQGREQVLARQAASQQSNYQTALQNALTGQGQQIGALQGAAGLAQPVGQFGMLTDPVTGQPINPSLLSGPVGQAVQLVQNGADPQGAAVQSLLAPLGLAGQSQFTQAMQQVQGGGYNPSAQSAYTNQNLAQAASTQGEAYSLNLGLQQLKSLQPVITNFLSSAGINSTTSPLYNQKINEYIGKLGNPAAMTQYAAMMGDLQKFASQMLAAGSGGTPTGVQAATELMNPGNLSMQQINSYLNTLDTLGTNQIAVLQQQSQAAYGGQGGYAGDPAHISSSTPVAARGTALGSGVQSQVGQFAAGAGLNLASWGARELGDLGSQLIGFLTRGLLKK